MSTMPWPTDHLLSLDEWAAMPEDKSHHCELVGGRIHVSPRPAQPHQRAVFRLGVQLAAQLPAKLEVLPEIEMVVTAGRRPTVRTPDIVVLPAERPDADARRCNAMDVLLAVEVVSPGSDDRDHVTKYIEYSEIGIPGYWVLDLEDQELSAFRLIDGEYEYVGRSGTEIWVTEPAELTIDVTALLPYRR